MRASMRPLACVRGRAAGNFPSCFHRSGEHYAVIPSPCYQALEQNAAQASRLSHTHAFGAVDTGASQRHSHAHTHPHTPKDTATPSANPGPLAGIRVLDFTRILAGPWCTQLLGDLGADVIKVEHPRSGDDTRAWGPPFTHGQSAYFLCANRNKRSLAVDIKSKRGRELVYELAKTCDVFVENFLPGKLESMGYGYSHLRALRPDIIYASLSGFGATGPLSQRAGYDVAIAAQAGLMSITGPADGAPVKVGVAVTDLSTGLYLHGAILAALFARTRTGQGQHIDTSLLECQIANLANIASNVLIAGTPTRRWGTAHESIAPYQAFEASDGEVIVAAMSDSQYRALCRAIQRTDLLEDPRYQTNPLRVKHRTELIAQLSDTFKTKPRSHWIEALTASGVTVAPINSVKEALEEPQVLHRGMIAEVPMPSIGSSIRVTAHPVKYSETPASIRRPPPVLGEHTAEVLAELGVSEAAMDDLVRSGIVGHPQPKHQ